MTEKLLTPGHNCWRLEHADRAAFLVDGAAYFAAFHAVLSQARHSILIVGWDLDCRLRLLRDGAPHDPPARLDEFLNALAARRRKLKVHVLVWDFAMIFALERELLPLFTLQWRAHRRVRFEMDGDHPLGASHHQKIVVVDDKVAFVGGLDLTKSRWDTPEHRPDEPRRVDASGQPYGPFHDVQMVVDGAAAAALGELARERWRRATGRNIPAPADSGQDPWPAGVEPAMRDLEVAIARTEPGHHGREPVREVERLYLDAIAAARRHIYIENQYLTSARLGRALAGRLAEADGPDVVLVLPAATSGWLEQSTMDVLRVRLLRELRQADRHGRLRTYYPDNPGLPATGINVHAKVMVVDDALVRVGSSNLSNRSLGLDTECDLAVAAAGREDLARAAAAFRNRLLAEHLDVAPGAVADALEREGRLIPAIEALRGDTSGPRRRTLRDLAGQVPELLEQTLPDASLIDPEETLDPADLTEYFVPDANHHSSSSKRGWYRLGAALAVLLALAAAWRWTPLGEILSVETITGWAQSLRDSPWGPPAALTAFLLAGVVAFPITVMIVVAALIFGPLWGFVYAIVGVLGAAALSFGIGAGLGRNTVRRLAGSRLNRVSRKLAEQGVLAMALIRVVPVAPFTVVNMVAGATHIRFRDFMLGTLLGMGPGTLALAVFADRVRAAAADPSPLTLAVAAAVVVVMAGVFYGLQRWYGKHRGKAVATTKASG